MMRIKIGPKGEVLSALPAGGDGLSPEVIACVIHRLQAAVFTPPDGGGATIVIPLMLRSRDVPAPLPAQPPPPAPRAKF